MPTAGYLFDTPEEAKAFLLGVNAVRVIPCDTGIDPMNPCLALLEDDELEENEIVDHRKVVADFADVCEKALREPGRLYAIPFVDETFGDLRLTGEEKRAIVAIWAAHQFGIAPALHRPEDAAIKVTADALVARGLAYRITADLEPDEDPDHAGYALKFEGLDAIAEQIYEGTGLTLGELF